MAACRYCGTPVGFGATRCNTETCYLQRINELEAALAERERRIAELNLERSIAAAELIPLRASMAEIRQLVAHDIGPRGTLLSVRTSIAVMDRWPPQRPQDGDKEET